jgi:Fe-S cluster biosynthesis and repair protein YggX
MEELFKTVCAKMSSIKQPQVKFMWILLSTLMIFQGKSTYRNLSRYSKISEKTYSRWYRREFDFMSINAGLINMHPTENREWIAAIDASFLEKSGKCTQGLGWFYCSTDNKAKKGLEISAIALVDLTSNTAYALDIRQTLDSDLLDNETRIDLYDQQLTQTAEALKKFKVLYLAADAFYAKKKMVSGVMSLGFHLISKLRCDANLRWLYHGDYQGKGRPKKYDGKVDFKIDQAKFIYAGELEDGSQVYYATVYSVTLEQKIRLVQIRPKNESRTKSALLFSTDEHLCPMKLVRYYKSRFQIEFLFRDAKQFTGLEDCQARCAKAIKTHINASMTALNLLKLEDQKQKETEQPTVISIASWKRKKFNEHFMKKLFSKLDLDPTCKKVTDAYEAFRDYGAIAA